MTQAVWNRDRFLIKQRIRPLVNQYEVTTLADDGKSPGSPVCFVQQKRFALREKLTAYEDPTKQNEVFRIGAEKVFEPAASYLVHDPDGRLIGRLKKRFGRSLRRSTWEIQDRDQHPLGSAQEQSALIAALRRLLQLLRLVPYVGDFLFVLIPYHFDYHLDGRRVGELKRVIHWRDQYRLDLTADTERVLDRRLAVALAICLDAMQSR